MGSQNLSEELRHAATYTRQTGLSADLVDAFGRVHIRASEDAGPGHGDRGTPTVLTKLKKWAGTVACSTGRVDPSRGVARGRPFPRHCTSLQNRHIARLRLCRGPRPSYKVPPHEDANVRRNHPELVVGASSKACAHDPAADRVTGAGAWAQGGADHRFWRTMTVSTLTTCWRITRRWGRGGRPLWSTCT